MLEIICIALLIILEVPFAIKLIQAHKNVEIIRETAIVIIMLIILLIIFGIYKTGLFVIG